MQILGMEGQSIGHETTVQVLIMHVPDWALQFLTLVSSTLVEPPWRVVAEEHVSTASLHIVLRFNGSLLLAWWITSGNWFLIATVLAPAVVDIHSHCLITKQVLAKPEFDWGILTSSLLFGGFSWNLHGDRFLSLWYLAKGDFLGDFLSSVFIYSTTFELGWTTDDTFTGVHLEGWVCIWSNSISE